MTKRLVICCDGTWNSPWEGEPTNVQRLYQRVLPRGDDGVEQRAHYLPGVGTGARGRLVDGMTGRGLSRNVRAAYAWLVEHFDPGDEVYLFGFSRGAFTARSAAGLIRRAGVLRRDQPDLDALVAQAYRLYRRGDAVATDDEPTAFRSEHSHETRIRCVGVWDTVGALGVPATIPLLNRVNRRFQFHDTALSSSVDAAFHAMALDERRSSFAPTLWTTREGGQGQVVEQVWFSGAHSDVGGGYADRALADLALWWMISRAGTCGLACADGGLPRDPAWSLGALHDSRRSVFRWQRGVDREIGAVDVRSESVGSWVVDRRQAMSGYGSPVLRHYLDAGGRVHTL